MTKQRRAVLDSLAPAPTSPQRATKAEAAKGKGSDEHIGPASASGHSRTRRCGRCGQPSLQVSAVLIALSSLLWGFGVTVLNVCIVPDAVGSILAELDLSTSEQEMATALVLIGACVSALSIGGIDHRFGHKTTIIVNNVFFIAGGLICAFAVTKTALFLGRFLIGIACGIVTNTVPLLLNEISTEHMRGQITSYHQLLLTIGILVAGLLGWILIERVPSGWRYLNGLMIVPAILQCALMPLIPKSPWWIMRTKGREHCRALLLHLRGEHDREVVETELAEIALAVESDATAAEVDWSHLWQHRSVLLVGIMMVIFQALTGINTVMLYSAKIFHFAGVTNPFLATTVVGVVNVAVTVLSVALVDRCGRRVLLLNGTAVMVVALIALSLDLLFLNSNLKLQGYIAVTSVLLFVGGFAVGLGAVVWVVLADITPVRIRPLAFSVYMGISYLCNIVVAVYTLSAISFLGTGSDLEKNGIAKLYFILAGVSVLSWAYTYVYIPAHYKADHGSDNADQAQRLLDGEEEGNDELERGKRTDL